jgi:hypothetical protein
MSQEPLQVEFDQSYWLRGTSLDLAHFGWDANDEPSQEPYMCSEESRKMVETADNLHQTLYGSPKKPRASSYGSYLAKKRKHRSHQGKRPASRNQVARKKQGALKKGAARKNPFLVTLKKPPPVLKKEKAMLDISQAPTLVQQPSQKKPPPSKKKKAIALQKNSLSTLDISQAPTSVQQPSQKKPPPSKSLLAKTSVTSIKEAKTPINLAVSSTKRPPKSRPKRSSSLPKKITKAIP